MVFSPINTPAAVELGIQAGLLAVVVGGIVAAVFGGAPLLITGPRASAAFILASLVKELSEQIPATAGGVPAGLLAWLFLAVALAGILQLTLAALHADQLIRRIPEPVSANFALIIGIIIILDQIRPLLTGAFGKRPSLPEFPTLIPLIEPGLAAIGLATLALTLLLMYHPRLGIRAIDKGKHITYRGLAPLIGLLAGTFAFHAYQPYFAPDNHSVLSDVVHLAGLSGSFNQALNLFPSWNEEISLTVAVHALLIAVMGALDSLVAAAVLEAERDVSFNPRRELAAQGLANVSSAFVGGIAVVGSLQRGKASADLGARHSSAGIASALFILVMVTVAWPVVGQIPLAILAAMLATTGIQMVADNIGRLGIDIAHVRSREHRPDAITSLLTAAVMIIPVLLVGAKLIWVTLAGIAVSIGGLLYKLSRRIVFRIYTGSERRSTELRSRENWERLQAADADIRVIELEGDLFFGTAIDLRQTIETLYEKSSSAKQRFLILDFSRVHELDDTGTRMLIQIIRRLKKRGIEVWLSYISAEESCRGKLTQLRRADMYQVCPETRWQDDTDHALECIEDIILGIGRDESLTAREFAELPICEGLSRDDSALLENILGSQTKLYAAESHIFNQGDPAENLYIVRSGDVKLQIAEGTSRDGSAPITKRVAALNPGAIFGSDAIINAGAVHRRRVASAIARQDTDVWVVTRDQLDRLEQSNPALAAHFYRAIAAEFADRIAILAREVSMVDA